MHISLTLFFLLSTVLLMGITDFAARTFSLYWQYPWLDIPMHLLGGVAVVLAIFSLAELLTSFPERYVTLVPILTVVLIVGLLWEFVEIQIGIPLLEADFEVDMISDLSMDVAGGILGYIVGSRISKL